MIEKLAEWDFEPGQKMIAFVVIPITEVKFSIKENKVEVKMFEVLTSVRLFSRDLTDFDPHIVIFRMASEIFALPMKILPK